MKPEARSLESKQNFEESRGEVAESTTARDQRLLVAQSSHVEEQSNDYETLFPRLRRGTGPRTPAGKRRSRSNALKSGIFASLLLIQGESAHEFELLRKGTFKSMPPGGTLEAECLEHIVAILWRRRRLLKAESVEIAVKVDDGPPHRCLEEVLKAWNIPFTGADSGRITNCDSIQSFLQQAKELLSKCCKVLREHGFQQADVPRLFREFYGVRNDDEVPTRHVRLFQDYSRLAREVPARKEVGQFVGDLVDEIIAEFCDEIHELEFLLKVEQDPRLRQRESVTAVLPSPEFSERSIRQWAHLSRELDRDLNRFERLQRMRKGQPGPPTLNVELNR